MSDAPGDQELAGYPSWVPRVVALPPIFFALTALADGGQGTGVTAALLGVAVLPWIVHAVRPDPPLPDTVFAAWVVVPIGILNLAGPFLGVDLSGESHNQFSLMVLVWLVGEVAARSSMRVIAGTLVAAVVTIAGRALVEPTFGHSWGFWLGGAGVALLTGFMLRRQQLTLAELRAAQAALAGEAARRERQRIAREVHDVVAHTLTVTLMHVQAARRAVDRDPEAVRDALRDAETLGRQSLADIRRTVGLLRADDDAPDTYALPDASDLPRLLESYRGAGVQVQAEIEGDLERLDPAPGLTLYRVVQEALSNAVGHSEGAPVEVHVAIDRRQVRVTVSNPIIRNGADRGGGLGIVGMRERVALLGGEVSAGVEGGNWKLVATFPRAETAPPAEVRT